MRKHLATLLAAVALINVSTLSWGVDIITPSGLNPGDTFRFIFVSTSTVAWYTTNFSSIDATLSNDASGYTYGGQSITWKAIVSTAGESARDRVGGYNTNVPVYLVTGGKVANNLTTSNNGLWSGSLLLAANVGISGSTINNNMITGTAVDGTTPLSAMGSSSPNYGVSSSTGNGWLYTDNAIFGSGGPFRVYGISNDLVVPVPEPSTYALGAIATGVMAYIARRRKARRA